MSKVFITHSQAVFGRRLDPNYHKVQHRIASRASSVRAELRRERAAIEDARLVAKRDDFIKSRIFTVCGVQVVLDRDLAELYGVQTKVLNQAVKRNANRFPPEFMFALTDEETENWSQIVTGSGAESDADGQDDRRVPRPLPDSRRQGAVSLWSIAEKSWPPVLRRLEDGCDVHPVDHGEDIASPMKSWNEIRKSVRRSRIHAQPNPRASRSRHSRNVKWYNTRHERQRRMNAGENQIVVYQPNETVRLVSGRMLIDNWATAAFDLPGKKRRGVKGVA